MTSLTPAPLHTEPRQALDFDCGVRAYPPTHPDGYWRLQAKGEALVAHYLDPTKSPARGRAWSLRHREEQQAYCECFVIPVIAHVELARLSRVHFARILAQARTASVASHLRPCCSAMVAAELEEGLLLARRDVLRGVRWSPPAARLPPTTTPRTLHRPGRHPHGQRRGCPCLGGGGAVRVVVAGAAGAGGGLLRAALGGNGRPHRRSGGRLPATRRR